MIDQIRQRKTAIRMEQMNETIQELEPEMDLEEPPEEFDNDAWMEAELEALDEEQERMI